jgi:hypothetical protein
MPEQLLDDIDGHAPGQEVCRRNVTEHVRSDGPLQASASGQRGEPLADGVVGHGTAKGRVAQADEREITVLRGWAGLPLGEVAVITGEHLGTHRHGPVSGLGPCPVRVVPGHHVQVSARERTAKRRSRRRQVQVMNHLIAGERNPKVLAQLARARARRKISELEAALEGAEFFTPAHAALLAAMLGRIDRVNAEISQLTEVIERLLAPHEEQLAQAESMPGWGRRAAQDAVAETGTDMARFPTGAHLASWAGRTPLDNSSGKRAGRARAKKGNRYLAGLLGETAVAAGKTKTREGARYRRLARRRGKPKAQVALGNTQLKVYHKLLSSPGMRYTDLGPDYYERQAGIRRQIAHHVGKLGALGFEVTLCHLPESAQADSGNTQAA